MCNLDYTRSLTTVFWALTADWNGLSNLPALVLNGITLSPMYLSIVSHVIHLEVYTGAATDVMVK